MLVFCVEYVFLTDLVIAPRLFYFHIVLLYIIDSWKSSPYNPQSIAGENVSV